MFSLLLHYHIGGACLEDETPGMFRLCTAHIDLEEILHSAEVRVIEVVIVEDLFIALLIKALDLEMIKHGGTGHRASEHDFM